MMDMKYPDEKSRWDFISECLHKYLSWGMKYMKANDPSIYALLYGDTGSILVFKNFKDKPIVEVGLYSAETGKRRYYVIHNLETGIAYCEQDDRLLADSFINEMAIISDAFATWYGDPMTRPFHMINAPIMKISIERKKRSMSSKEIADEIAKKLLEGWEEL